MADDVDLAGLTNRILSEQASVYERDGGQLLPQAALDAVGDFKSAISDQIAAGTQLEADARDLRSKRDLLPREGFQRLRRDAVTEAQRTALDADVRAAQALDRLRGALADAAVPRLDPAREALARDELRTALDGAHGDRAAERALAVASSGSPEAAAALLGSSFGETLLKARGLEGRDLREAMQGARTAAAAAAVKRGTTPREVLVGKLSEQVDGLAAARGAAGTFLSHQIEGATR